MKDRLRILTDMMASPPPEEPVPWWGWVVIFVAVLMHLAMIDRAVDTQTLLVQIPALVFFSLEAFVLLLPIVSSTGRRRLAEWPSVGRRYVVILAVWLVASGVFVLLTGTLYQQGVLRLEGVNLSNDSIAGEAFAFYLWNFLDAIPLLDIPEALRWEVPYEYRDVWSGLLLISFKILVVIPVIAAITIRKAPVQDHS